MSSCMCVVSKKSQRVFQCKKEKRKEEEILKKKKKKKKGLTTAAVPDAQCLMLLPHT